MTDAIKKVIELRAPIDRVWRAISDSTEFSQWFQADFESPFVAGSRSYATMNSQSCGRVRWFIEVVAVEAPNRLVFRWQPSADDPTLDYSSEPMTTVEFTLRPTDTGTEVTIVESGFDALIDPARRAAAFAGNTKGWAFQADNLVRYFDEN